MTKWNVDGACFVVDTVTREGSFQGGEGTRMEAVVDEVLTEVDSGRFFFQEAVGRWI